MYSLNIENYKNEILNLTETKKYTVFKIEGLSVPKANISQSENSNEDGGIINNIRISSRNLLIYVYINPDIESNRINLYKYFLPKKNVKVYFSNKTRNVFIEGIVESIECDLFTNKQLAQISIICPNPYFCDINKKITQFSNIKSLFEFPLSITKAGQEISCVSGAERKVIFNNGDIESGVIITITAVGGNVVNPIIYNVLDRTFLKLNMEIAQSDIVTISTIKNNKYISLDRDGIKHNVIGYLAENSTWFQLKPGDNVFRITDRKRS